MTRVRRLVALLLLLAAIQAAPAHAAGDGVEEFVVTRHAVTVTVRGASLDPASLQVKLDGKDVAVTSELRRQAAPVAPRMVLVLDTSGSMAGPPIVAARQAAADFVRRMDTAAQIGLVSFADSPAVLVRPTTDHGKVLGALARLRTKGNTSLYDAVATGLDALGATGPRRLVVLSDGADTSSTATLSALTRRVQASGAQLDAVALTSSEATSAGLRGLAAAARGRVVPVSSAAALGAAFRKIPVAVTDQVVVQVPLGKDLAGKRVGVSVSISSAAGVLARNEPVSVPGLARVTASTPASKTALWIGMGVVGGGILLLLLAILLLTTGDSGDRRRTRNLVQGYGLAVGPDEADPAVGRFGEGAIARTAVEWAGRVGHEEGVGRRALALDRAGLNFTPAEWLLLQVTAAAAGAAVGGVLLTSWVLAAIGLVVGLVAPMAFVSIRGARRIAAFQEQLPDSLRLVSSSLMSGYAFAQALDGLVREGSEPMSGEISRALAEARLGVSLEDALDRVAERMSSKDLHWTVMAVRVQRDVGGNLAEVLNTVAATVRERAYLRRQVSTLTAEGRLSAGILVAMPVLVGLYTFANRRDYMEPLWTTAPGLVMAVGAVALTVVGALWMRKLVDVEV
jgi:Flp pilus assembly protein TadB/Mg-chelatase subunit ChlD